MCDPASAIGFGLSAAGQVAGFAAKQQAVDKANAEARQNAINANVAATQQYGDAGRKLSMDAKKINQEGYKAEMAARQAAGTARSSGASSGIDIRSGTMKGILAAMAQDNAMDQYNVKTNLDAAKDTYSQTTKQAKAQAEGRINSMPMRDDPSPVGMMLGIATNAFDSISSTKQGKNWLGT